MNAKEIVGAIFGTIFRVVIAIIAIMLIYRFSVIAYEYGTRVFDEEPMTIGDGTTVTVTVTQGQSAKEIGTMLEEQGVIRDGTLFMIQEMLSEYKDSLQPGTYELNTSMTSDEIMAFMSQSSETATGSTETTTQTETTAETVTDDGTLTEEVE